MMIQDRYIDAVQKALTDEFEPYRVFDDGEARRLAIEAIATIQRLLAADGLEIVPLVRSLSTP